MRKLKSAFVGVDQGSVHLFSDYDTDGPMWSRTGDREVAKRIMFSEPFARPPAVTVQIAMLDSHSDHFLRMSYDATDVTCAGFTLVFKTWSDTRLAQVKMSWQAIGELPQDDDWLAVSQDPDHWALTD